MRTPAPSPPPATPSSRAVSLAPPPSPSSACPARRSAALQQLPDSSVQILHRPGHCRGDCIEMPAYKLGSLARGRHRCLSMSALRATLKLPAACTQRQARSSCRCICKYICMYTCIHVCVCVCVCIHSCYVQKIGSAFIFWG